METKRTYEGMYLISQQVAATFGEAIKHIRETIESAGGEIIAMKKWDERRLAYEIDKQKRGVYILCYFEAPTSALIKIENNCNLSEQILRTMFTRTDHLTPEEISANDERQALADEANLRATRALADDDDDDTVTAAVTEDEDFDDEEV
jgi:small subunit ribosomal protein S6